MIIEKKEIVLKTSILSFDFMLTVKKISSKNFKKSVFTALLNMSPYCYLTLHVQLLATTAHYSHDSLTTSIQVHPL